MQCSTVRTHATCSCAVVWEDPWHASVYCGDNGQPWTLGAYAVASTLLLLACAAAVGTLIDKIDRAFYKLEVAQDRRLEAEVLVTNAAVHAAISTPPMADVDADPVSIRPLLLQQSQRGPGTNPRSGAPTPRAGATRDTVDTDREVAVSRWQGVSAELSFDRLVRSGGGGDVFGGLGGNGGGGGGLVAASSAARISLGGAASLGRSTPRAMVASAHLYGSPVGVEMPSSVATFGNGDGMSAPFPSSSRQLRSVHSTSSNYGAGLLERSRAAAEGVNSSATTPRKPSTMTRLRAAGDFPDTEGATDASAAFIGHVRDRRNSSISEGDDGGPTRNAARSQPPYDVQRGPLLRAAVKCFSLIHNWPRMISISGERCGPCPARHDLQTRF